MSQDRVFVTGDYYHLYNRGVAKQVVFHDEKDFRQFLNCLSFYLEKDPPQKLSLVKQQNQLAEILVGQPEHPLVEILCYCLMPNHFHLLVRQVTDGGVTTFMRRALLSYTRYYNTRYNRVGPLFQGNFQTVPVTTDEQLLHVSRYIHLNPPVAKLSKFPEQYRWSSMEQYNFAKSSRVCNPTMLIGMTGSAEAYAEFVGDYASYAQDLHAIKDLLHDLR